ncbi:MAG TPA: type II toxin-antitoxin system RelE/ParE family toxin [Caulobacteraceae bacterium]
MSLVARLGISAIRCNRVVILTIGSPMSTIGQGVREIRSREVDGAFRVIYLARFESAIYVLHCFQKKTQKTSREDIALATRRYKDLLKELS